MREGEILAMKKSWINLNEDLIIVPRQAQKRKQKEQCVPINSVIRPRVENLLNKNEGSDYVFINPQTETRYTKNQNSWNGILRKAGLKGKAGIGKLRFHDLRHTAATNLERAGKDINQYLGHTDVKTSARYIHYSDDDLKQGAEILARVTSNFTTPKKESLEIKCPRSSGG
jgi:integrase